jgi:hypothetical protein
MGKIASKAGDDFALQVFCETQYTRFQTIQGGRIAMPDDAPPMPPKCQHRVQAVLALFRGEAVAQVSTQYQICRSDLYKFQRRAVERPWRSWGLGRVSQLLDLHVRIPPLEHRA